MSRLPPTSDDVFWDGFDEQERVFIEKNWDELIFALQRFPSANRCKHPLLDTVPELRSHLGTLLARWTNYEDNVEERILNRPYNIREGIRRQQEDFLSSLRRQKEAREYMARRRRNLKNC